MSIHIERLNALRAALAERHLDGFVVPRADEHLSEYVGAYAKRLAWLTGFFGSAGTAVVFPTHAAIFVDGRYTLQVRQQVDERHWSFQSLRQTTLADWLGEQAPDGARVGYDPWLHTRQWVQTVTAALARKSARLVAVEANPIDAVWADRPAPSAAKLVAHAEQLAGKSSACKRRDIAAELAALKADAVILCALDSVAWTFNVRGQDVEHTPVALAFAAIHADSTADLFVAPQKLTDEVIAHLGGDVRLHPRDAFVSYLCTLSDKRIVVDPARTAAVIASVLENAGAEVLQARDPAVLPKAIKNSVEIAGHRAAQVRDGAALCCFLHWLATHAPHGGQSEFSAASKLREFREQTGRLRDISFDTISAAGPNGAIVHYYVTDETNRPIEPGSLFLIDSGGQYLDGTTDVTRTVAIGKPSVEMRDRFTRVLKGHIALACVIFPAGTRGFQLDLLARQYLWAIGKDYEHGTGHGIGAYLDVHEGPQIIHSSVRAEEPLAAGMIVSNEPGYYKTGEYGIRIENLMLVVKREIPGAEREMLGFETLSFAPIDRALIDLALLTSAERAWIDAYHKKVAETIAPQLEGTAQAWVIDATRPLA